MPLDGSHMVMPRVLIELRRSGDKARLPVVNMIPYSITYHHPWLLPVTHSFLLPLFLPLLLLLVSPPPPPFFPPFLLPLSIFLLLLLLLLLFLQLREVLTTISSLLARSRLRWTTRHIVVSESSHAMRVTSPLLNTTTVPPRPSMRGRTSLSGAPMTTWE